MTLLSREALITPQSLPVDEVEIPDLGGRVRVQGLTLAGRDEWESSVVQTHGKNVEVNRQNLRARLIERCLVDAGGKRLLQDGDAQFIGQLSAAALEGVFAACQRLSGLDAEDVEILAGNSERGQPA